MKPRTIKHLTLIFMLLALLTAPSYARLSSQEIAYSREAEIAINTSYIADFDFLTSRSVLYEATIKFRINMSNLDNQKITDAQSSLESQSEDELFFSITNVRESQELPIGILLSYETSRHFPKVSRQIDFPYFFSESELEEISIYLEPTELINSDHIAIKRSGSDVVEGEEDYYSAIMKVASFVEDRVDYTLDSMTQSATQKASWVLINKKGVCDEISVLFIAMLRSVGIPARFVSGVAYTNSELFDFEWGNHGWTEVYFPGHGWIPFDITYKEMGYTNPLRVAYRKSNDASTGMIEYSWASKDVKLNVYQESMSVYYSITRKDTFNELMPEISIKPAVEKVGFGSFNAIDVEIKNPYNYYLPVSIAISTPKEVVSMDADYAFLVLKPGEKITKRFVVYVADYLLPTYSYTLPATIILNFERLNTNFSAARNFDIYSQDFFLIEEEADDEGLSVELSCDIAEYLYLNKSNPVACEIANKGNRLLAGKACFANECLDVEVFISEIAELNFSYMPKEKGWQKLTLSFLGSSKPYDVNVIEQPDAEIRVADIQTQGITESKVLFEVMPEGQLLNAEGKILINGKEATSFNFDEMSIPYEIPVLVGKEWLRKESTSIEMVLKFEDVLGKEYERKGEGLIILEGLSFWDKVVLFFRRLFWHA